MLLDSYHLLQTTDSRLLTLGQPHFEALEHPNIEIRGLIRSWSDWISYSENPAPIPFVCRSFSAAFLLLISYLQNKSIYLIKVQYTPMMEK